MLSVENCVVVNEKICQETGKKIRESKSVQKVIHLTFRVRGLQLHTVFFNISFCISLFLNFRTNDDERSLGFLQEVESLQQIPISGKHLFKQEGNAT
jgi:hypothetical protein